MFVRFLPLVFLVAVLALVVNVGLKAYRFVQLFWPKFSHPVVFGLGFAAVILVPIVCSLVGQNAGVEWLRYLAIVGDVMMVVVLYSALAVAVVDACRLIGRATRLLSDPAPRALAISTGAVVIALVAGLVTYGVVNRTFVLRTPSYDVTLASPSGAQPDVKIALVADLHLGQVNREGHLDDVVDAIIGADADLIVLAGDSFDGNYYSIGDPEPICAQLRRLSAPLGVFAVLGNHDGGSTAPKMVEFLESCGIDVLLDEAVSIADRFTLVGRRDSSPIMGGVGERTDVPGLAEGTLLQPVIVVDHQPSHLRDYVGMADLMLSGHTHAGQLWPFTLVVNAMFEVSYGHYQVPDETLQAVVTSGAGTWGPPLRVGTFSEVASITLHFTA
jgi:predicted MPP superfamily phosphohydrolase